MEKSRKLPSGSGHTLNLKKMRLRNSRSKILKRIKVCLSLRQHSHMLHWLKEPGVFRIKLIHKKNPTWDKECISLLEDLDKISPKRYLVYKQSADYDSQCRVRFNNNLRKMELDKAIKIIRKFKKNKSTTFIDCQIENFRAEVRGDSLSESDPTQIPSMEDENVPVTYTTINKDHAKVLRICNAALPGEPGGSGIQSGNVGVPEQGVNQDRGLAERLLINYGASIDTLCGSLQNGNGASTDTLCGSVQNGNGASIDMLYGSVQNGNGAQVEFFNNPMGLKLEPEPSNQEMCFIGGVAVNIYISPDHPTSFINNDGGSELQNGNVAHQEGVNTDAALEEAFQMLLNNGASIDTMRGSVQNGNSDQVEFCNKPMGFKLQPEPSLQKETVETVSIQLPESMAALKTVQNPLHDPSSPRKELTEADFMATDKQLTDQSLLMDDVFNSDDLSMYGHEHERKNGCTQQQSASEDDSLIDDLNRSFYEEFFNFDTFGNDVLSSEFGGSVTENGNVAQGQGATQDVCLMDFDEEDSSLPSPNLKSAANPFLTSTVENFWNKN